VRGEHVNPLALFRALDAGRERCAIFVADGGDFVATASYVLRPRGPLAWLDPGAFGTLGVGAGFAIGAAQAAARAARCGSSSATAPAAGAWPSSTASCVRASR
jgi:thiamine pyrophosphate-dependent acetolactate synthase large subunit-like protein